MGLINSFSSVMGPPVFLWHTSSGKERDDTAWDVPFEKMIQRAPHTIAEAGGTIIKHSTFATDNKMLFVKLAEIT